MGPRPLSLYVHYVENIGSIILVAVVVCLLNKMRVFKTPILMWAKLCSHVWSLNEINIICLSLKNHMRYMDNPGVSEKFKEKYNQE